MIKLVIDGVCKNCFAKDLMLFEAVDGYVVYCRHEAVCKYIEKEDPKNCANGAE